MHTWPHGGEAQENILTWPHGDTMTGVYTWMATLWYSPEGYAYMVTWLYRKEEIDQHVQMMVHDLRICLHYMT